MKLFLSPFFKLFSVCFFVSYMRAEPIIDLRNDSLCVQVKLYKTTDVDRNGGDVYEHSVWTARCIEQWFDQQSFWVDGLSVEDKRVMVFAGFLHDIGKAGDHKFVFLCKNKRSHPQDGLQYLIGKKNFLTDDNRVFDFKRWFKFHNISEEEKKRIAVLVGVHYNFGAIVLRAIEQGCSQKKKLEVFENYLKKLENLAQQVNYNKGKIDRALVIQSILICVADVKGFQPIEYPDSQFNFGECYKKHPGKHPYENFNVEVIGRQARQELLEYFDYFWRRN